MHCRDLKYGSDRAGCGSSSPRWLGRKGLGCPRPHRIRAGGERTSATVRITRQVGGCHVRFRQSPEAADGSPGLARPRKRLRRTR